MALAMRNRPLFLRLPLTVLLLVGTVPNHANRALGLEGGACGGRTAPVQFTDRLEDGYYTLAVLTTQTDGVNLSPMELPALRGVWEPRRRLWSA